VHSFWISRGLSLIKALGGPLPTNKIHKVARSQVSAELLLRLMMIDVAGAERSGDFVVAAVAAIAAVAAVTAVVADNADDVLGDLFLEGWFDVFACFVRGGQDDGTWRDACVELET